MSKRNWIIIAIVTLVGVVAGVLAAVGNRPRTYKEINIDNKESIVAIFIADNRDHHVVLRRTYGDEGDSAWRVDDSCYASKEMVEGLLLETLTKMRIREKVNKSAVPNVLKNLSASNTKVEVYEYRYAINWFGGKLKLFPREKKTATYFVGHETQDMMGTYMLRDGDKEPLVVYIPGFRGILNTRFIADPIAWRSHRIMDVAVKSIDEVSLEITGEPQESFVVKRRGEGFELIAGGLLVEGFDTVRVAQMLASFTKLNFDEYASAVPQAELDTTFRHAPKAILRVKEVNGREHEVKTYVKYANPDDLQTIADTSMYNTFDLNRLYAVVDNRDTVLIQYYTFDNILQPASFFTGREMRRIE